MDIKLIKKIIFISALVIAVGNFIKILIVRSQTPPGT